MYLYELERSDVNDIKGNLLGFNYNVVVYRVKQRHKPTSTTTFYSIARLPDPDPDLKTLVKQTLVYSSLNRENALDHEVHSKAATEAYDFFVESERSKHFSILTTGSAKSHLTPRRLKF